MQELVEQLKTISKTREIRRFSPQEMVELLQDGEEVGWIVGQVLPEGPAEAAQELGAVLCQIAAQVASPGEAGPEPAAEVPAEAVVEAVWKDLEKLDLPPGMDLGQFRQLLESPQGTLMADFGVFCQEKGVSVSADSREARALFRDLHEEWLHTPRPALEGKKPAEMLGGGQLFPARVETFRREAPKVGRNDPCPCGSGKKYKKCCGKEE